MIDLDALVNDPRFLPWSGWFDDRIKSVGEWISKGRSGEWSGQKCAELNMCAIQQHGAEFKEFAAVLEKLGINGKCLQLGLGNPGASHLVWHNLFKQAITIDDNSYDGGGVTNYLSRIPEHKDEILVMDTHNLHTVSVVERYAPFDFLFIDTDHAYHNVKDEYEKYSPMVRPGGIVAFHDTVWHTEYDSRYEVWRFMNELRSGGVELHDIGNELGISYMVK